MSFQQGLSGLNATAKNLSVIGNNIANVNTVGAKSARAEFGDVYAAALGGGSSSPIGLGTKLTMVAQQFTQGNIKATDGPMDLAINGAGFFQVSDGNNPISYTRNGQFKVDREGYIVDNKQRRLMGYAADAQGSILRGQAAALQLPTGGLSPLSTSKATLEMNLDSRVKVVIPATGPAIDYNDADTYNSATSMTVYDAKGQEIALTYFFQKTSADNWNVYATANGTPLAGTAAAPVPITTITYPSDGSSPTAPSAPLSIDIPASVNSAGTATMAITGLQLDLTRSTQWGTGFAVTNMIQDGYAAGKLSTVSVEPNGTLLARYSNGQSRPAGQIELMNFRNPQGLQPQGDNTWARSFSSGEPLAGVPGEGSLGVLQAGALEESNIELTGELVSMIVAQRIYQANAQTVKTEDQLLQTLVNLR